MHDKFSPANKAHFSQKIATASLKKKKQAQISPIRKTFLVSYAVGRWRLCSIFYDTRHDWKKYNQSQLGKEKSALLRFMIRVRFFGKTRKGIVDPRSLGSRSIKGTEESFPIVGSSNR